MKDEEYIIDDEEQSLDKAYQPLVPYCMTFTVNMCSFIDVIRHRIGDEQLQLHPVPNTDYQCHKLTYININSCQYVLFITIICVLNYIVYH